MMSKNSILTGVEPGTFWTVLNDDRSILNQQLANKVAQEPFLQTFLNPLRLSIKKNSIKNKITLRPRKSAAG